jgi:hypothetical protein
MVNFIVTTGVGIISDGGASGCDLSFVVAARSRDAGARWLDRVLPQLGGTQAEIVMVGPGVDVGWSDSQHVLAEYAAESALTPELWTRGILLSRGEVVVVTIADCLPSNTWVKAIAAGVEEASTAAAIGGVIELDASGGPADWALYFLRYSAYMPPVPQARVADIAADNAVYRRIALDRCSPLWRDGFWEPRIHAWLRQASLPILLDPRIVVWHRHSLAVGQFSRQRFQHGRTFGAGRVIGQPAANRVLRTVLAPAAFAALLGRVVARVLRKRRHRLRLLASLPILVWFIACWIAGETVGYVAGPPSRAGDEAAVEEPPARTAS